VPLITQQQHACIARCVEVIDLEEDFDGEEHHVEEQGLEGNFYTKAAQLKCITKLFTL
jgi:hypothetical protein